MANSSNANGARTRMITEGGLCIALSIVLSFLKIPIGLSFGGFGGSIDLVMVPLVIYALKWGTGWGIAGGFIFGTLKYFLSSGAVIHWISIIFDYSVAYAAVGLAGLFMLKDKAPGAAKSALAAFVGCLGRFLIHFISGVTVYAEWMPEEFLSHKMTSPAVYSLLYNGTYMLPNTILCVAVVALLAVPLRRLYMSK